MPAPSPSTKPSRPLSKGGSALRLVVAGDSARIAAKAPMFSCMIAASVPPASTMSARPDLIMSIP